MKKDELDLKIPIWVIAATNRIDMLTVEMKSRFAIKHLHACNCADFLTMVKGVLVLRENTSLELTPRGWME
ncbi:MAG: hypothetical protein PHY28_00150 [Dehalococcoidales bacterium]|nr:hypothetical protein [Dehalococcoidales bacterium]